MIHLPREILKPSWFLAGPTACGKSEIAVELAQRIGAEIVSMDSMSLYRGMDVGTAKPSRELCARIPHHLVDMIEPDEEYSVAEYVAAAGRAAAEIVGRGAIPLFVGGTGLYLRSLLRGVFDGPANDPAIREALEAEAGHIPAQELHDRLRSVDPVAAERIHPHDLRRIIRALEVHAKTGRPLSEFHLQSPLPPEERSINVYWISPPRPWLYERINRRVEQMLADGLLDEVGRLLETARTLSRTARQALGYQEAIDHLNGKLSCTEMITTIKTRTRQFAKRQHTWFRHLAECRAVDMTGEECPAELAERIIASSSP